MKALFISFVVGLVVGVVYGVIRVKSPAPPIVALLGLLGMVLGEQAGGWLLTKKIQAANVASAHIVHAFNIDACLSDHGTGDPLVKPPLIERRFDVPRTIGGCNR